jgi:plasmid stabilization system protein ParE
VFDQSANLIGRLRTFPRLGRPAVMNGTLGRIVPRSPYVIVYRTDLGDRDELVTLRVYHAAQDRLLGEY